MTAANRTAWRRIGIAAAVAALGATPAAAATLEELGRDGYYVVGATVDVDRVLNGAALPVCAPDVDALPSNLVHRRPPPAEIARSLSVGFCDAALVDVATLDSVLDDAAAMAVAVEARRLAPAAGPLRQVAQAPFGAATTFSEAYEALAAGEAARAADLFAEGLAREPSNYAAHYYLGSAYEQMGRADYAAVQYRRVAETWPGTTEAVAAASALERVEGGGTEAAAEAQDDGDVFGDVLRSIGAIFETSPGADAAVAPPTTSAPNDGAAGAEVVEIVYGDGARYQGTVLGEQPHGQGELIYADGARYAGRFRAGLRHGDGRLTLTDGLVYQGAFVDDVIDGRGRLAWPDGAVYEGDFRRGARTGEGVYQWPSGSRYEGRFDDGTIVGPGVFVSSSGARYEGEFKDGRRTGRGVLIQPDGVRLEGEFVDGRLVGR